MDKCTAIDRLLQYTGFLNDFIVFRERGREGKREGARETSIGCLHMPPNGDLAHHPGMCPDWKLNPLAVRSPALDPLSHTSQGCNILLKGITIFPMSVRGSCCFVVRTDEHRSCGEADRDSLVQCDVGQFDCSKPQFCHL